MVKMSKKAAAKKETPFDPNNVKSQFDRALPKVITEIADLLEQPVPRLKKRDKLQIAYQRSSTSDPIVRMFSILYINGYSVRDTEHYEISVIKTTASAGEADLKKTGY
jgi:hypothetical protein